MKRVTSGKIIQLRMLQIIFGGGTSDSHRRGRLGPCPWPCPQETFAAVAHEPLAHREIMKIFFRAASIFPDNCRRRGSKGGRTYSFSQIRDEIAPRLPRISATKIKVYTLILLHPDFSAFQPSYSWAFGPPIKHEKLYAPSPQPSPPMGERE
jgi:hypothetical protein